VTLGLPIMTVAIHEFLVYLSVVVVREGMILTDVNALVLDRHVAPIHQE